MLSSYKKIFIKVYKLSNISNLVEISTSKYKIKRKMKIYKKKEKEKNKRW